MNERSPPRYLRSDSGPEFVSKAILEWLEAAGVQTALIDPGKPWQNGMDESFNGRFREGCLSSNGSAAGARPIYQDGTIRQSASGRWKRPDWRHFQRAAGYNNAACHARSNRPREELPGLHARARTLRGPAVVKGTALGPDRLMRLADGIGAASSCEPAGSDEGSGARTSPALPQGRMQESRGRHARFQGHGRVASHAEMVLPVAAIPMRRKSRCDTA